MADTKVPPPAKASKEPCPVALDVADDEKRDVAIGQTEEIDLYKPLPVNSNMRQENPRVLTFRAVFLGCLIGSLVNAANLYLGLKTATTIGANMFGALMGFVVLKGISVALPETFPLLGGFFGVRENSIVQTAAITSGGLSFIFIAGVPAMYRLNLLSEKPEQDYWRLVTFTFICAFYGLMFAAPMRNFFIRSAARDMSLLFPATTACTVMMKALHDSAGGLKESKKQMKLCGWVFLASVVFVVTAQYAPGIMWDWHVFTWFYIWSGYSNAALAVESWFWYIEWTPAFFGMGMVIGPNLAFSFFFGSILAWGIIGPAIVHQGYAVGIQPFVGTKWEPYTIFGSMAVSVDTPSPYYWMIWPAVMILLCSSVTDFLAHYKVIYRSMRMATARLKQLVRRTDRGQEDHDEPRVSWTICVPGTIVMIIVSCVVLYHQYDMPVETCVVSLIFGFVLAFITIQVQGMTDNSPLTAITKLSQLAIGGMTRGSGVPLVDATRINIAGAQVSGGAAYAAAELIMDFRIGYLLGTPVMQQFIVQILGNVCAVFISPAIFILFAKAYPCIIHLDETGTCSFLVPGAQSWSAIATAVLSPGFRIPTSAAVTALVLGGVSVALSLLKSLYLVRERAKYRLYVPNMTMVGFAMILPATCYSTAMTMGAIAMMLWSWRWPKAATFFGIALASGLILGESIGGIVNAILTIAGVGGSVYRTNIACPGGSC